MIKVSSLFGQILSEIFSAVDFEKLVVKHKAELRAKGFRSRTQLISMLFCHLARADSLRKVKTFIGTSENALRIQIWTALAPQGAFSSMFLTEQRIHLVSMLVLKWLHHLSRAPWSFSNMATMLRLNLFTYRDLRAWLNEPYETPPGIPRPEQLNLNMQ